MLPRLMNAAFEPLPRENLLTATNAIAVAVGGTTVALLFKYIARVVETVEGKEGRRKIATMRHIWDGFWRAVFTSRTCSLI
ncbi:hypothetical protein GUJ93_ZPchr0006g41003 [Zizania palustris]|uniref:Uncharacterized protein n=1 Tax=Zizania palustris TaxID=103762 RepID=A0A8J5SJG9_ZIZPA|nr:hypothetical protein GUJ93_ZPchr0006g41003 [Zizania palustris]